MTAIPSRSVADDAGRPLRLAGTEPDPTFDSNSAPPPRRVLSVSPHDVEMRAMMHSSLEVVRELHERLVLGASMLEALEQQIARAELAIEQAGRRESRLRDLEARLEERAGARSFDAR